MLCVWYFVKDSQNDLPSVGFIISVFQRRKLREIVQFVQRHSQ